MSKDRTTEFLSICKTIGQPGQQLSPLRQAQKSQFTRSCKELGGDITKTWDQLERLTQLCKSTTLFNDKPVEIEELTYIIKQQMDQTR